jgi:hypothetical protein
VQNSHRIAWIEQRMEYAAEKLDAIGKKIIAASQMATQVEVAATYGEDFGEPIDGVVTFLQLACDGTTPPLAGAIVYFIEAGEPLVPTPSNTYTTDASGEITFSQSTAYLYDIYLSISAGAPIVVDVNWHYDGGQRSYTINIPINRECWPECTTAKLRSLFLTDQHSKRSPTTLLTTGVVWLKATSVASDSCLLARTVYIRHDLSKWDPSTGYATISGGSVVSVTITNYGSGYSAAPTITCGNATFSATLSGDRLASVSIVDGGSGITGTTQNLQFYNTLGVLNFPDFPTHPLYLRWNEGLCRGNRVLVAYTFGSGPPPTYNRSVKALPSVTCSPFSAVYDFDSVLTALGSPRLPYPTGSAVVTLTEV